MEPNIQVCSQNITEGHIHTQNNNEGHNTQTCTKYYRGTYFTDNTDILKSITVTLSLEKMGA